MSTHKAPATPLESPRYAKLVAAIATHMWETADYWAAQLAKQFPEESATTYWNMASEDVHADDFGCPTCALPIGASFDPFSLSDFI